MVHWPEAMVTLDLKNGVLFSADAFGSFKSLDGALFADEVPFKTEWIDEVRRYYTNIVGKYGPHVMNLFKESFSCRYKNDLPAARPCMERGYTMDH